MTFEGRRHLNIPEDIKKMTVGVVAICFNEERDLPGFLRCLIPWVDEIILVDDGSHDQTETLALAAGVKVKFLKAPRRDGEYFSHQRNKGIDASDSDWLLHMDIDERVSPNMASEILSAVNSGSYDAFKFRRRNYFLHRPMNGGGWKDWNLVHLAKRDELRFAGMFHEDCIVRSTGDRIGQIKQQMIHFNEENFEKRLAKSHQYLEEVVVRFQNRARKVNGIEIFARPVAEFFRKFIVKKGFLDGTPGVISAMHSATATFRALALVWDQKNSIPRKDIEADVRDMWDNSDVQFKDQQ